VIRTWSESLDHARRRLAESDARGAFIAAFNALEICYNQRVSALASEKDGDRFASVCKSLFSQHQIPKADYDLALHLGKARNTVLHLFGFEPSLAEASRTIEKVLRLCSRFAARVGDIMAQPVRCARREDPVGLFLREMRELGISQFPVIDGDDHVVGTLDEGALFSRLETGIGNLHPETVVADIMRTELLPEINPDAPLDEAWRMLQRQSVGALLVLEQRRPKGIVTKFDLLRAKEL
jgi:predicted transcriptional regulator